MSEQGFSRKDIAYIVASFVFLILMTTYSLSQTGWIEAIEGTLFAVVLIVIVLAIGFYWEKRRR